MLCLKIAGRSKTDVGTVNVSTVDTGTGTH